MKITIFSTLIGLSLWENVVAQDEYLKPSNLRKRLTKKTEVATLRDQKRALDAALYTDGEILSVNSPVTSGYQNAWDGELSFYSNTPFCGLYSYHDNHREDRRWKFRTCDFQQSWAFPASGEYLAYETMWDDTWKLECTQDKVITGISSYHSNSKEDRRWRIQCTHYDNVVTTNCAETDYINDWDGVLNYSCPANKVMRAIKSRHDNGKEDRQFKVCTSSINSE